MFSKLSGYAKVLTNASAGYNILKEAVEELKQAIVRIDGRPWEEIANTSDDSSNYDLTVFSTMTQLLDIFPNSLSGLFSIDSSNVKKLTESIDPFGVPKINSEKTYQLGLAIQKMYAVLEEEAVKNIMQGLIQAGKLNENNFNKRIKLLNKRMEDYNLFYQICHSLDKVNDNDLLHRIAIAQSKKSLERLIKEFLAYQTLVHEAHAAFLFQSGFIEECDTESVDKLAKHFNQRFEKLATIADPINKAIHSQRELIQNRTEQYTDQFENSVGNRKMRDQKLKELGVEVNVGFKQFMAAREQLSRVRFAHQSAFRNDPKLPNLLSQSLESLEEDKSQFESSLRQACDFFEKILPTLALMGDEPINLDYETQRQLIEFLNLDVCEDIASPKWQKRMSFNREILLMGASYHESYWFTKLLYQANDFFMDNEEDISDAEYFYELIQEKLFVYKAQLGLTVSETEEFYIPRNEFLTLESYNQAIAYKKKQPQREAIQAAEIKLLDTKYQHLLSKQSFDIFNLQCRLADISEVKHLANGLHEKLKSNDDGSVVEQIPLLEDIVGAYGLCHEQGKPHKPSLDSLSRILTQQLSELRQIQGEMVALVESDPNSVVLKHFQQSIEASQLKVYELEEAIPTIQTQAQKALQAEKDNMYDESRLMVTLKAFVKRFESSQLSGSELINAKEKINKQLSTLASKIKTIHDDNQKDTLFDIAEDEHLLIIKQLQQRVNAISAPNKSANDNGLFKPAPKNNFSQLRDKYFGTDAENDNGLFDSYLQKRAEKYVFKDILRNIAAIFFGCFGYKTDQCLRKEYITEIKQLADHYFSNPGNSDAKQEFQTKIAYGFSQFSPRSKPGQAGYEDSLHALLTKFEQEVNSISQEKEQEIEHSVELV